MTYHPLLVMILVAAVSAAEGQPADWSGLLAADFASVAGWVVSPGADDQVTLTVSNRAQVAWSGTVRVETCDRDGRVFDAQERALRVPGEGMATDRASLPLRARGQGEHLVRWRLLRGPKDDRTQDIGWERSCVVAGPRAAFVLFEREPIARGLDFARTHVAPLEITSGGLRRWIWRATHGSAEVEWWRSVRFTFSDPAFRDGRMPVVDVDLRARQAADAPLTITADTAGGGGQIAFGWGGRGPGYAEDPPWRGLGAQLDDARFSTRIHAGKPDDLLASGCDLRFNNCTANGEIRSLVVLGHDRHHPDWTRLLRPLGVELGSDRYVFAPGTAITARLRLANRALVPYRGKLTARLASDLDVERWRRDLPVDLAADSSGEITIPIDTTGLPWGVYRLDLRVGDHIATRTLFGLSDLAPLAKAGAGEFLYGCDLGGHWRETRKLDWADYMGMDLVRNCAGGLDELDGSIPALRARGLQGTLIIDPPWHPDPAERARLATERAARLETAARTHGAFLRWYELGNEPDLPFFYAGPIDAYLDGYRALHAAVKRGDPDSVVMNGGLCFHGEDGWRRAHELIAKVPGDLVDAWAYHGHGPGIGAERAAWERQDRAVRAVGKGGRPLLETESGLHAVTPVELRRQAQTIVEKAVFAQSMSAPFLLWFSLHMGESEWGYTTIEREREPRPAVLAHRAMVATLRGLRHAGTLDLSANGAEGHHFAAADGRRALVLWSDRGDLTRTIAIGSGCSDLRRVDLFGNVTVEREVAAGQARLVIGADPVYLVWRTGDPAVVARCLPPALVAPERVRVVPGRPTQVTLTVRNDGTQSLAARLVATPQGEIPLRAMSEPSATVAAGAAVVINLPLTVAAVEPTAWPRQWTVFAPVDGEVDLATIRDLPRTLSVRGATLRAQTGLPRAGDLDLAPLAGGVRERRQALCFAWLESASAQTITIGAAADWWMEWYVNGERIGSTMADGNQAACHILAHRFTARLKPGRNLLAVRVLSGSGGFRLVAGGPDEVAAAQRERDGARDALLVDLHGPAGVLARTGIAVEVLRPLEALRGDPDWETLAPDGELGAVLNLHHAQPDASRWYQGADDCSGRIWVRHAGDQVRIAIAVRDDRAQRGDACLARLAIGPTLGERVDVTLTARRDDAAKLTWHTGVITRALLGGDRFALQVVARDDDWGEPKQEARWGEGEDPESWFQSWVR